MSRYLQQCLDLGPLDIELDQANLRCPCLLEQLAEGKTSDLNCAVSGGTNV